MSNTIIIVMCLRNLDRVILCPENEAAEKANQLLKEHVGEIGYWDEFESGSGEGIKWRLATPDNPNAWCSLGGIVWDAFIIQPPDWSVSMQNEQKKQWKDNPDIDYYELYVDGQEIAVMHGPSWSERDIRIGYEFTAYPAANWCISHEPVDAATLEEAKVAVERALVDIYQSQINQWTNAIYYNAAKINALLFSVEDGEI